MKSGIELLTKDSVIFDPDCNSESDEELEELNKKGNFMFITTVSHAGNEKKAIIKKSLIKFAE